MKKIAATKLRELLADVRVHSESQLLKPVLPTPPVISFRPANRHQRGRWVVTRVGYKTDPEHGHFLDGGNKIFPINNVNVKETQRTVAIDWASEKYGHTIDEWEKTPFGSWVPKAALISALWHYLPELFEKPTTTIYIPPTKLPDTRPLDEVIKKIPNHGDVLRIEGLSSIEDTGVRVAALDAYSEVWLPSKGLVRDHERAMRAALQAAVPIAHVHLNARENDTSTINISNESSVDTDGWYRVVGANVAVFIQATSTHDAKTRVEHMIDRMTMDVTLDLHITKRDPEVS